MSEEITPIVSTKSPLPTNVPPDEHRQDKPQQKKQNKEKPEQTENEEKKQQHGLFDEYV